MIWQCFGVIYSHWQVPNKFEILGNGPSFLAIINAFSGNHKSPKWLSFIILELSTLRASEQARQAVSQTWFSLNESSNWISSSNKAQVQKFYIEPNMNKTRLDSVKTRNTREATYRYKETAQEVAKRNDNFTDDNKAHYLKYEMRCKEIEVNLYLFYIIIED